MTCQFDFINWHFGELTGVVLRLGRWVGGINADSVQSSHLNADKVTFIGCLSPGPTSSCSFEQSVASRQSCPNALSAPGPPLGQCNDVPCIWNFLASTSSPVEKASPAVFAYVNSPDKWRSNRGCLQCRHNCIITHCCSCSCVVYACSSCEAKRLTNSNLNFKPIKIAKLFAFDFKSWTKVLFVWLIFTQQTGCENLKRDLNNLCQTALYHAEIISIEIK